MVNIIFDIKTYVTLKSTHQVKTLFQAKTNLKLEFYCHTAGVFFVAISYSTIIVSHREWVCCSDLVYDIHCRAICACVTISYLRLDPLCFPVGTAWYCTIRGSWNAWSISCVFRVPSCPSDVCSGSGYRVGDLVITQH